MQGSGHSFLPGCVVSSTQPADAAAEPASPVPRHCFMTLAFALLHSPGLDLTPRTALILKLNIQIPF